MSLFPTGHLCQFVGNISFSMLMDRKHYFVLLLPLLWGVCSLINFYFPGEDYKMYFLSSFAGSWIVLLFGFSDIHNVVIPIATIGAIVMAGFGYLMDYLQIRKMFWVVTFTVCVSAVFAFSNLFHPSIAIVLSKSGCALGDTLLMIKERLYAYFPSLAKVFSKNRSGCAYICFAFNNGLYLSVIFPLLLSGIRSLRTISNSSRLHKTDLAKLAHFNLKRNTCD